MRWISVNERLPSPDSCVLACVFDAQNSVYLCMSMCFVSKRGQWIDFDSNEAVHGIDYWMPLPEYPNEKEETPHP